MQLKQWTGIMDVTGFVMLTLLSAPWKGHENFSGEYGVVVGIFTPMRFRILAMLAFFILLASHGLKLRALFPRGPLGPAASPEVTVEGPVE